MRRKFAWAGAILLILLLVLAAFAWTPDTDPAAMRAAYGGPPSRFADLGGGLRVHYRDEGPRDAPAIVLLHGSNADLHTWDAWTARLAPRFRVIRFDQIDHGLTGPNPANRYDANAFADTVERLTTRLGVPRFGLAGNSMGGWVAWEYARRHPGRLNGLVLIDAGGAPVANDRPPPIGFRIAQTPWLRPLMAHVTPRAVIERTLRASFVDQRRVTPAMIDRYWRLLRYPGNRAATARRFATPRAVPTYNQIACIAIPTLILWGAEDRLIPLAAARWFRAAIPNSRLIVYPGVGHIAQEDAPDATARDVAAWLATLPPR